MSTRSRMTAILASAILASLLMFLAVLPGLPSGVAAVSFGMGGRR